MNDVIYDDQFNANEWFIIISLLVGIIMVVILPKRFTKKTTGVFLMCGVFFGFFFDHTLSVIPFSFYDLNDHSHFELIDFVSHFMYGPYCYLFFYLYDLFRIKPRFSLLYLLIWLVLCISLERISLALGIYHFRRGYNTYYSLEIYMVVFLIWVAFYHVIKRYKNRRF